MFNHMPVCLKIYEVYFLASATLPVLFSEERSPDLSVRPRPELRLFCTAQNFCKETSSHHLLSLSPLSLSLFPRCVRELDGAIPLASYFVPRKCT